MTDLLVARTPDLSGSGKVTFNLFSPPATTRGVQFLGQQVVSLLLREFDSRYGRGTSLIPNLQAGLLANNATIRNALALAQLQLRSQLPTAGDPDELLDTIDVVDVQRYAGGARIYLRITSQAGNAAIFEIPRLL